MRTLFSNIVEGVRIAFTKSNNWREATIQTFLALPYIAPLFRYITPNTLGYMRIGAAFLVVGFYMQEAFGLSLAFFLFGAFTDLIDGPLARLKNQVTEEGKTLDAVADKAFILAPLLFIGYAQLHSMTIWTVIFMETLLILISNVLKPYLRQKHNIPLATGSNAFGQSKMVAQSVALGIMLLNPRNSALIEIGETLIWIAVALSVGSILRHLARLERKVEPERLIITPANLITLSGIFVAPVIVSSLLNEDLNTAAILLIWMFASDVLDGLVARMRNQVTNFGTVLDPIRDALTRTVMIVWFIITLPDPVIRTVLILTLFIECAIWIANFSFARRLKTVMLVTPWGKRRGFVHGVVCIAVFIHTIYPFIGTLYEKTAIRSLFFLLFCSSIIALISYVHQGSRLLEKRDFNN